MRSAVQPCPALAVLRASVARRYVQAALQRSALFDSLSAWAGPYRLEGDKLIVDVDTAWTEVWSGKPQVRSRARP
jgi:hypothetical protein